MLFKACLAITGLQGFALNLEIRTGIFDHLQAEGKEVQADA
jgi:hypothetical protein